MKVQIDCYGFEATSEHFQRRKIEAFLVKEDGGIVYACFGTGEKGFRGSGTPSDSESQTIMVG